MMTLRQLRVFDAVASTGSIARAAEALNMSQSAASAALKELQQSLKRPPLFHHVGRGLKITSEGARLQPVVRTLLREATEIESPSEDRNLTGTISIGAGETGDYLLPRLAASFHRRHPGVRIDIIGGPTNDITAMLSSFAIDSMITDSLTRAPGAYLTEIYRERLVFFAAADHPLARRGTASFVDLAEAEWCMAERKSMTNRRMLDALRGHVANFRVAMEINSDAGIREAVRAGCGMSCLPLSAVEGDLASGQLGEIRVEGLNPLRPTFLVRMANVKRGAAARAFDEHVIEAMKLT
ncbi:MAG: LysR substrate-binding domain-containing protein [Sphingobium sp.]